MADETNNKNQYQAPEPRPELRQFDKLIGTWNISGEATGQTTFEWMDGGFFLIQHGELVRFGRKMKIVEYIGYEQKFGAEPPEEITSHAYTSMGGVFEYTYEVDDNSLTIWMGTKNSPDVFRGTFSEDRNTLTGAWESSGGGYSASMTRVKE